METANTTETVVNTAGANFDKIVESLRNIKTEIDVFDKNTFEKKADLNKCSVDIRKSINGVRQVLGSFNKKINEVTIDRRESFDGTPEERIKKQEDKLKKMQEACARAKEKLQEAKKAV